MIKKKQNYSITDFQSLFSIFFLLFSVFFTIVIILINSRSSTYSFFIEFSNSYGITKGTSIRMRGIQVGSIQSMQLKLNGVLVLAQIDSSNILIPKNSIIETTQTGLLNEAVIDIIPLKLLKQDNTIYSPLSSNCDSNYIICNQNYILGDRGLNYDDLIRSTTRISQRFDDPRFFSLFYVFLQNGIEVTDTILELMSNLLDLTSIAYISLQNFFSN